MTEQISKNEQAERICGRRQRGNAVFELHELGYACPICGASDETTLYWSEYNYFIYCKNCNLDIPSCLCKKYPESRLTDKPLSKRERVIENTKVFLRCLEEMQEKTIKKRNKDLKQATIEWYKELNWTNIVELSDGDFIYEGEEVRKFIKYFFNLTEEELSDARNRID